jgi:hypothetical protein
VPFDAVQLLLDRATGDGTWPPKSEAKHWQHVLTYRAIYESDKDRLMVIHDWKPEDAGRYRVDALPERIALAWADHLYGEDPTITPAADQDSTLLDPIVSGEFVSDLREAAAANVGEGEQWWRVYVDHDVADVPLLEWHSRLEVLPLFVGSKLKAAALVTELEGATEREKWRHLEVHADGFVEHLLYRGDDNRLGERVPLGSHPETEGLPDRWDHGLPMLMGRVYNGRHYRGAGKLGRSEYVPIIDQLLDLNEAASIGARNMRLTARKRLVVPETAVTPQTIGPKAENLVDRGDGTFDKVPSAEWREDDLIVAPTLDREMGRDPAADYKVLEYAFDAEPLIAWKIDLVETALTRIGLTGQWVGVRTGGQDGYAITGTALRLRLVPTTKAGHGKAKQWDDVLPRILSLMAQVDQLPESNGGFGRAWTDPTTPPSVERADPLPVDPVEDAQVESTLVGAKVRSTRTSVKAQHPDWSDDEVDTELEEIRGDQPAPPTIVAAPPPPPPGSNGGPPDPTGGLPNAGATDGATGAPAVPPTPPV